MWDINAKRHFAVTSETFLLTCFDDLRRKPQYFCFCGRIFPPNFSIKLNLTNSLSMAEPGDGTLSARGTSECRILEI